MKALNLTVHTTFFIFHLQVCFALAINFVLTEIHPQTSFLLRSDLKLQIYHYFTKKTDIFLVSSQKLTY
jgi:hypothetical protein